MSNQYTLQLRSANHNFITTLDNGLIMGSISFTRTIDNGYGDMKLQYNEPWTTGTITPYQIIKVYQGSDLIYRGYVSDIEQITNNAGEYVICKIIGLQAILNNTPYMDGVNTVFTKTADPITLIQEIIAQHNTGVGRTMFDATGLTAYGSNINMEFDNVNALQAVKSIIDQIGYIVDYMPNGQVKVFTPNIYSINHPLVYGLHVTEIKKKRKTTEMANRFTLRYGDGTLSYTANNLDSQSKYGLIWRTKEDQRVKNTPTAIIRAETELAKGAEPILQLEMIIQNNYLNDLNIGDTIAIKNKKSEYYGLTWFDAGSAGLTWEDFEVGGTNESTWEENNPVYPYIAKIDYLDTYKVITLGDYDSLSKSLTKL